MQDESSFSQTGHEERANAASHALGCVLAPFAVPALAQQVDAAQHPMRQMGVTVFVASMVLMYLVSAVYHAAPVGAAKRWLRKCDHAVIFLFIAGSYTPFALAALQRGRGAGGAHNLRALANLQLDAMHHGTHRNVPDRQGVADTDRGLCATHDAGTDLKATGRDDVAALAVGIANQGDMS